MEKRRERTQKNTKVPGKACEEARAELALLDVRRRHPEADAREQALRVASRWMDTDLMLRAFGWDVTSQGF